eukprot:TRINITY_DN31617_c0_g1_i1.p1 TRINITY_DN31617_c0_g1~~TRINITY_DN31617_c0_g1_i1.p1  ORF type:complete len:173 (+),score=29.74 TRINITY_DN31617_c0_g1_i1:89-607(+)
MIRRPPRSTLSSSSAASDVYKRQVTNMANRHNRHNPFESHAKRVNTMDTIMNNMKMVHQSWVLHGGSRVVVREDVGSIQPSEERHALWAQAINGQGTRWQDSGFRRPHRHAPGLALGSECPSDAPHLLDEDPLLGTRIVTFHLIHNLSLIHISEPTRLLSISYAVFCLKKKT